MAILITQNITSNGLVLDLSAASAGGDRIQNGPQVVLYIENSSGSQRNITVLTQKFSTRKQGFGPLIKTNKVFTLEDGEKGYIGTFAGAFEDNKSRVRFIYDNEAGLDIAAVNLPRPIQDFIPAISPPSFCAVSVYDFVGPYPKTLTLAQAGITNEITVTAGGGGGSGGVNPLTASKSTTGFLTVENTFKTNSGGNAGFIGNVMTQINKPQAVNVGIVVQLTGGGNGILFDFISFSTIGSSFSVIYPFTISTKLDQAAGTATFEFEDGVNDLSGSANVSGDYDNTKFIYCGAIITAIGAGDAIVLESNNGSEAFILAGSEGKVCDYITKTFCKFDEPTNFNNGASQTLELETGFAKATSVGGANDSIQIQGTPFSETTGLSKGEGFYFASTGAGTDFGGGVVYFDADAGAANVTVGLQYEPEVGGGTLRDLQSGSSVETGVAMVAGVYKAWFVFDHAAGTATYEDTEGNSGALSVGTYSPGDNLFRGSTCNASDTSSDTFTTGVNFGETEFSDTTGNGYCEV